MRRHRKPPDFSASFLDMFLSALGGVAFLLIIFSATASQNAKRNANLSYRPMVVEILDDAALPNYLTIGRLGNIGITLFNGDGDSVGCYGPDPDSGQALQVQFQEPARHLHQIQIRAPEADDLFILVWLANIQNIQGDVDVGKARPILKGNKPIQLRVTWNERTFPVTLQSPEFSTLIPLQ